MLIPCRCRGCWRIQNIIQYSRSYSELHCALAFLSYLHIYLILLDFYRHKFIHWHILTVHGMHERNGKNTIFSVVCVFERLSAIRCLFYIYACNLLKWFSMDFSSFLALRFVLSLYYYFFGAWPTSRFNFCSSFSVIRGFWYSSWLAFFFFHFLSLHFAIGT